MPDEVHVPGIGGAKKEHVTAFIAVGVGIVGYAWWKNRSSSTPPTPVLAPNDVVPATDYAPAATGDATQSVDTTAGTITDNATWTQRATEILSGYGFDPMLIASALGKYLSRKGLTAKEIDAVTTAIGVVGYPPVGGPYPITPAGATPAPAPKPAPSPVPFPSIPYQPPPPPPPPPAPAGPRTYTVRSGDTLWAIAGRMYGNPTRYPQIYAANSGLIESVAHSHGKANSGSGHWIYPGTVLVIP